MANNDVITVLESIKERITEYDKKMPHYTDAYHEELIRADIEALDKAISIIQGRE